MSAQPRAGTSAIPYSAKTGEAATTATSSAATRRKAGGGGAAGDGRPRERQPRPPRLRLEHEIPGGMEDGRAQHEEHGDERHASDFLEALDQRVSLHHHGAVPAAGDAADA